MLFHFSPSTHELWDPSHSSCTGLVHAFVERRELAAWILNFPLQIHAQRIWVWRLESWCAPPHHGKVGEEGSPREKLSKEKAPWHGWEGAGWAASSWAGSRCFSSGGFKEWLGRGGKWEKNFHAILQHLVLPGLWSQGEGAEPLEPAWEQVGEGAAVICSRRSLATTWSRWKAGYHWAEPPPAAPQPPQPLLCRGSWGSTANSTRELFSRQ